MLMILARLVRSESFWAVAKVRSPHTGPGIRYIITHTAHPRAKRALHFECRGAPVVRRGDARVAPPCPTTSCVWRSLPYLTLPYRRWDCRPRPRLPCDCTGWRAPTDGDT